MRTLYSLLSSTALRCAEYEACYLALPWTTGSHWPNSCHAELTLNSAETEGGTANRYILEILSSEIHNLEPTHDEIIILQWFNT